MTTNRKLQSEIDRVLKRVNEGIAAFEDTWERIYSASNDHQKEKYETDLKKEIKKLQRYREQIKAWASSTEVKNKSPLLTARKHVEIQMERFKLCEKEAKTKAYSKEGLSQAASISNYAQLSAKASSSLLWISKAQESIRNQLHEVMAEMETLLANSKKSKSSSSKQNLAKIEDLQRKIDRHNYHLTEIATMKNNLENGKVTVTAVNELRDDIEYYVNNNQDPDFVDDELLYSDINNADNMDDTSNDDNESDYSSAERDIDSESKFANKSNKPTFSNANKSQHSSLSSRISSNPRNQITSGNINPLISNIQPNKQNPISPMKSKIKSSNTTQQTKMLPPSQLPKTLIPGTTGISIQGYNKHIMPDSIPTSVSGYSSVVKKGVSKASPSPSITFSAKVQEAPRVSLTSPMDSSMPFSNIPRPNEQSLSDSKSEPKIDEHLLKAMNVSSQSQPDISDAEKQRQYMPRNPAKTPSYFPSNSLPIFDNPAIFDKFDIDTLFFMFYFQQGTNHQYPIYMAARELKKQAWRYHKKYQTWFQRHEEPKITTDDYEQGTYVYFDYETGWCQRIKTEFTFEYRYLEDELQV